MLKAVLVPVFSVRNDSWYFWESDWNNSNIFYVILDRLI